MALSVSKATKKLKAAIEKQSENTVTTNKNNTAVWSSGRDAEGRTAAGAKGGSTKSTKTSVPSYRTRGIVPTKTAADKSSTQKKQSSNKTIYSGGGKDFIPRTASTKVDKAISKTVSQTGAGVNKKIYGKSTYDTFSDLSNRSVDKTTSYYNKSPFLKNITPSLSKIDTKTESGRYYSDVQKAIRATTPEIRALYNKAIKEADADTSLSELERERRKQRAANLAINAGFDNLEKSYLRMVQDTTLPFAKQSKAWDDYSSAKSSHARYKVKTENDDVSSYQKQIDDLTANKPVETGNKYMDKLYGSGLFEDTRGQYIKSAHQTNALYDKVKPLADISEEIQKNPERRQYYAEKYQTDENFRRQYDKWEQDYEKYAPLLQTSLQNYSIAKDKAEAEDAKNTVLYQAKKALNEAFSPAAKTARKYGLDERTFSYDDLSKWATEHNYVWQGNTFNGGELIPTKNATTEDKNDFSVLSALAKKNYKEQVAPQKAKELMSVPVAAPIIKAVSDVFLPVAELIAEKPLNIINQALFDKPYTTDISDARKILNGSARQAWGNNAFSNGVLTLGEGIGQFVGYAALANVLSGVGGLTASAALSSAEAAKQIEATAKITQNVLRSEYFVSGLEDGIMSVKERGGSLKQGVALGIAYGATEVLFNEFGTERLFKMIGKPTTSILREMRISGMGEFGEEFLTSIAQRLSDGAIMGDRSEYELYKKQLMQNGLSENDASIRAFVEFYMLQPFKEGAAGFGTGAILGGTNAVFSTFYAGRYAGENYSDYINDIVNIQNTDYTSKRGQAEALKKDILKWADRGEGAKNKAAANWARGHAVAGMQQLHGTSKLIITQSASEDAKLTPEKREFLANAAANRLNTDIVIAHLNDRFKTDNKGGGLIKRGKWHSSGNTLFIDPSATIKEIQDAVLFHELTHASESSRHYGQYADYVKNRLGAEEFNERIEKAMEEDGTLTKEDAVYEVVANYTRYELFQSADEMKKFVESNYSIADKVINSLKDVRDSVYNHFGMELPDDNGLRYFERALGTRRAGVDTGTRYAMDTVKGSLDFDEQFDYNSIIDVIPVRKLKMRQFPSQKSSAGSDAHKEATIWAYDEDVPNGKRKIAFYRGGIYVIEKFDSINFKYQIVGKVSNKKLAEVREEYVKNVRDTRQPDFEEGTDVHSSRHRGQYGNERGGYFAGDNSIEYGRKDKGIHQLGSIENNQREDNSNGQRSIKPSELDRPQVRNSNSAIASNDTDQTETLKGTRFFDAQNLDGKVRYSKDVLTDEEAEALNAENSKRRAGVDTGTRYAKSYLTSNGKVQYNKTNQLILPKQEYAMVSSARTAKNAGLSEREIKPVDYVYAADEFYVYENNSANDFTVKQKINIAGNEDLVNGVREVIDNGTIQSTDAVMRMVQEYKHTEGRYYRDNGGIEEAGAYRDNVGVSFRKPEGDTIGHSGGNSQNNAGINNTDQTETLKGTRFFDAQNLDGKVRYSKDVLTDEEAEALNAENSKRRAEAAREVTSRLLDGYSSEADSAEVQSRIKEIWDIMDRLKPNDKEAINSLTDKIDEAASYILKQAKGIPNAEADERYKDVVNYLRGTRILINESAKSDIPDYNDFRKKYFRKLNIKVVPDGEYTDGMPLDSLYKELSSEFPEYFSEENETTQSDQLIRISEVMDGLHGAPDTDITEEATPYIKSDILKSYEQFKAGDFDRNAISKLYESLIGKDVSYDATKDALGANGESFKYARLSNAKTYNKARAYVDARGITEIEGRLTERALQGKLWNADEMAQAEYIFTQLQKQGKTQEAVNFAVTFSGQATKAGQAVQAMAILNRLTPEGKLLYITRMSERATEDNIKNKMWSDKKRQQFERELQEAKKKDAREKKNADELEDLYRRKIKESGELADLFALSPEDFEREVQRRKEQIEKYNRERKDALHKLKEKEGELNNAQDELGTLEGDRQRIKNTEEKIDAFEKEISEAEGKRNERIKKEAEATHAKAAEIQKKLAGIMRRVSDKLNLDGFEGNAKSVQSLFDKVVRKIDNEENFDYSILTPKDHVRAVLKLKSYEQAAQVIKELQKEFGDINVEIKDDPESGYFGIHITSQLDGLNAEIQLHTAEGWEIKKKSDEIYHKWRNKDKTKYTKDERLEYKKDMETSKNMFKDYFSILGLDTRDIKKSLEGLDEIQSSPKLTSSDTQLPSLNTNGGSPSSNGDLSTSNPDSSTRRSSKFTSRPAITNFSDIDNTSFNNLSISQREENVKLSEKRKKLSELKKQQKQDERIQRKIEKTEEKIDSLEIEVETWNKRIEKLKDSRDRLKVLEKTLRRLQGQGEVKTNVEKVYDKYKIDYMPEWQREYASEVLDTLDRIDSKEDLVNLIMRQSGMRGTKQGERLRNQLMKSDIEINKDRAWRQVLRMAQDAEHTPVSKKLSTWRIQAMLMGVPTWTRNIISNTAFGAVDAAANNLAVVFDALAKPFTGRRTVAFDRSFGFGGMKEGANAFRESNIDIKLDIQQGDSKYGLGRKQVFKSKPLSAIERGMGYVLQSTDAFAEAMAESTTEKRLKALRDKKLVDFTDEEIAKFAKDESLYRTFKDDNAFVQALTGIKRNMNKLGVENFGLGDIVAPFVQVPGNIVMRGIEYSPLGYLKALTAIGEAKKTGIDGATQRKAALALGRATTGTGLIATAVYLAALGILNSADDDKDDENKKETSLWQAMGRKGTTINLSALKRVIKGETGKLQDGDATIAFEWFQPISTMLAMGAAINESLGKGVGDISSLVFAKTWDEILEAPVFQGINTLLGSDYKSFGEKAVTLAVDGLTSFLPRQVSQLAQFADTKQRSVYTESNIWEKSKNRVMYSIPGLRQMLPEKVNQMGEAAANTTGNRAFDFFNSFLNPGRVTTYREDPVAKALLDLGDASIIPDNITSWKNKKISGVVTSLYGKDLEDYKKTYGQEVYAAYKEVMDTEAYKNADSNAKISMLTDIKKKATEAAQTKFAAKHGLIEGGETETAETSDYGGMAQSAADKAEAKETPYKQRQYDNKESFNKFAKESLSASIETENAINEAIKSKAEPNAEVLAICDTKQSYAPLTVDYTNIFEYTKDKQKHVIGVPPEKIPEIISAVEKEARAEQDKVMSEAGFASLDTDTKYKRLNDAKNAVIKKHREQLKKTYGAKGGE